MARKAQGADSPPVQELSTRPEAVPGPEADPRSTPAGRGAALGQQGAVDQARGSPGAVQQVHLKYRTVSQKTGRLLEF